MTINLNPITKESNQHSTKWTEIIVVVNKKFVLATMTRLARQAKLLAASCRVQVPVWNALDTQPYRVLRWLRSRNQKVAANRTGGELTQIIMLAAGETMFHEVTATPRIEGFSAAEGCYGTITANPSKS